MSPAGGSARREYERRRAADRQVIRRNLPVTIAVVVLTPFIAYLAVRGGVLVLNHWGSSALGVRNPTTGVRTPGPKRLLDPRSANLLALVLAASATVSVATTFWGRPASTKAWQKGAEGEQGVARRLAGLESKGFRVLHDLGVPRSKANIDHLVIGPTGVFAVDTKNYTGRVTWSKGTLWHGKYPMTKTLETTRWEAEQAGIALGVAVVPLMCVLGAEMPRRTMDVAGVRIVSGGAALVKDIARRPPVMTGGAVDQMATAASATLRPAI